MIDEDKNESWPMLGAVAAVLVCCLGPVLLAGLGLSVASLGRAAVAAAPYLLAGGVAIAGAGLYWARRRRTRCGDRRASGADAVRPPEEEL